MKKCLHLFNYVLLTLLLTGFCVVTVQAQFTPTLFRALNLNGAALTISGNNFEASATAPNFNYTQTGGGAFGVQNVTLIPSTDANRSTMIRSSIWGNLVNVNVTSVPNGSYDVFVYVWEDNAAQVYSLYLEGNLVQANYNSGSAGTWSRLGPFRASITDGAVNIAASGGHACLSGLEVWTAPNPPVLSNPLTDQTAVAGQPFSFTVPSNTFTDVDPGTVLTYSASLSNGSALPSWLTFNATTRTFSGTPAVANAAALNIKVNVSDGNGGTCSDVFMLTVNTNGYTFYRAINLNGAAMAFDGNNWEASASASNFSYNNASGAFSSTTIPLNPTVDANRTSMIRSSIWGNVNLNVGAIPSATYAVWIYVWEDSSPATYSFSIEGTSAISNYNSGNAGSWAKLGPFIRTITDGTLNLSVTGIDATLSGIEIHYTNRSPVVANALADQTAIVGETFSYVVPANAFTDPDPGATLTYSASLSNGNPLPSWLTFNTSTRTFSGMPVSGDAAALNLKVTATDIDGATINDVFLLTINTGLYTFYRAINLNGSALTIDGKSWTASAGAPNFSYNNASGAFSSTTIPLVPPTDANRTSMIRSSIWGNVNLTMSSVPAGSYAIWVYVWEDTGPITFSISLEGTTALSNYSSGTAGTWAKLGPFLRTINDGAINMSVTGIEATISGLEVYLTTPTIPVTGITVTPTTATLSPSQTQQLTKTITPSNATNQNVTWSSNNSAVATVSTSGLVTAVTPGSATITATTIFGNLTAATTIAVAIPVTGVSLSPTTLSLVPGQTGQLTKNITPSNATNQNVTWSSSNTAVATVNINGLVTAVAGGTAAITATTASGSFTTSTTVTVGILVTGVTVTPGALELHPGQTSDLTETISPANAANKSVTWSSTNTNVATVNISGIVTAVAPGSVNIIVTTTDGSFTAQSEITVSESGDASSVLQQFAFQYKYDERNRMSHKKVPGADWVYMVYDNRDRLVMTQDGNQRTAQEWTFTKYDELNRPILTGIYAGPGDQDAMQTIVDSFYAAADNVGNADEWFEVRGSVVHGYSNQSFPKVTDETQYLIATYYDDYSYKTLIESSASEFEYDENQLEASGGDPGQRSEEFRRVQGQVTGSKIKNLDTNEFLWNVNYYDDRYRVIQVVSQNNKGGLDKITNVYDFVGKVLRTKTDHTTTGPHPVAVATSRKLMYDHAGRLLQTEHKTAHENEGEITTTGPSVLVKNEYNELGQLVTKKLHSENATNYKQQIDYRYNIRGWLTRINDSNLSEMDGGPKDYFGMELGYNESIGITAGLQHNGNISAIKWSTNQGFGFNDSGLEIFEPTARAYAFDYDPLNRLKKSDHFENTVGWNAGESFHENIDKYDLNGNIEKLSRTGKRGSNMDKLYYSYSGNRLQKVVDDGNDGEGFTDGNTTGIDYIYDDNGNMVTDKNKSIATIEYNHLNLPDKVIKEDGQYVKYIYNAAGSKLRQEVYDASHELKKKTDYLGEFHYENDTLKFINHEEGRIVMTGPRPEYQYTLKDHLGNSRITFTTIQHVESFVAHMNTGREEEEQLDFGAYNSFTNEALDPTPTGSENDKILILNGGYSGQVGLTKSFSVVPGDIIATEVHAKYLEPTGNPSNLVNFAAALTEAFGLTPNLPGEGATAFEALNSFGSFIAGGARDDENNEPRGFINIIVFDKDYNFVDAAFRQIKASDLPTTDTISLNLKIRQAGYAYVFLSNESPTLQQIGFDTYVATQHHSDVIQQDDYYPFGLTFNSYQRENTAANKYLFNNGSEIQTDLDLGFYSTLFRTYDPAIGRFMQSDPLADFFSGITPYNFAFDNPISYNDPDGLAPMWFLQLRANLKQAWYNATGRGNQHAIIHGKNKGRMVEIGARTAGQRPTPNPKSEQVARNYSKDDSSQESTITPTPKPNPEPEPTSNPTPLPEPTPDPTPDPIFKGRSIPANKSISFSENISFNGDSDKMYETPQNDKIINDLVKTLKDYPQLKLFIVGNTGTAQRNPGESYGNGKDALSKRAYLNGAQTTVGGLMSARAKAIYDALVQSGIDASRLDYGPGTHYPSTKGRSTSFVLKN